MSFYATFFLDGKEMEVLEAQFKLYQEVDHAGRPTSVTKGGAITLKLASNGEDLLFEWMCMPFMHKDGRVVFYRPEDGATLKELRFKEARLTSYEEHFVSTTAKPMTTTIVISTDEMQYGNVRHTNNWG